MTGDADFNVIEDLGLDKVLQDSADFIEVDDDEDKKGDDWIPMCGCYSEQPVPLQHECVDCQCTATDASVVSETSTSIIVTPERRPECMWTAVIVPPRRLCSIRWQHRQ